MKRRLAIASIVLGTLGLAMLDASFVQALGTPFRLVGFVLVASLFFIIVMRDYLGFLVFGLGTLISTLTASVSVIMPILVGLAVLMLVSRLAERLFTNRTYYSVLAVASVGWGLYHVILALLFLLISLLGNPVYSLMLPSLRELAASWLVMAVCMTAAYLCTVLFSKKIRSYFIVGSASR
ncbi:MAG: hypothetical protein HY461_02345 [Parcubacteria group bacterium]|nr:hypothetical protein [Parcubacteria group bacterium]